jgi:hypothetical protein
VADERKLAADCRRHAAEARRWANAASTPAEGAVFLDLERRWLTLARKHQARIRAPLKRKLHRKGGAKD